jgi:hypothetical protein
MRLAILLVSGLLPWQALAGELPQRFTLGRYLPGDVWFYAHGVRNPESAWLDKEWSEVFDALRQSGIERDIASLVVSVVGKDDLAAGEATAAKWTELITGVRWGDMCSEEFALAERLPVEKFASAGGTFREPFAPEYIALMRGKADAVESNVKGLLAICKEITTLSDKIQLTEQTVNGVPVWSLGARSAGTTGPGFGLHVFHKGDIIGLAVGLQPFKDVIDLMTGKSERPAIVATPRFLGALAEVKSPEDSLMFADVKQVFRDVSVLMGVVERHAQSTGTEKDAKAAGLVRGLLELCNVFDHTITSVETQGRQVFTHTVARIREEKRESVAVRAFLSRRPFERFDHFIPIDAAGYHISTLFDLELIYKAVIDLVREGLPNGIGQLADWDVLLAASGFDPQRDLFSWWSGEMVLVSLPPAAGMPMGGSDFMLAVRVKDTALASQKVNAAIDFINTKLQAHSQGLIITPAPVSAEGFRQITHPLVMMFARPVIGVKDDWLMIGGSATAVDKCLAVAEGKAPSIMENERFKSEGLIPKDAVQSASFKDTSKLGEELGVAAGVAGMFVGGILTAGMQEDPKLAKVAQAVRTLISMAMKLAPVLKKIDFYSSQSSVTTYDGALTVRTEMVVTYKPPPPEQPQTVGAK